jgi:hypothetical protein
MIDKTLGLKRKTANIDILSRRNFARVWSALIVVSLTACARQENAHIYPVDLFGQRVVGNASYVTVSNVWNEMDALPLAERHCAGYGKSARFTHMEGSRAIYDCVNG